MQGGNSTLLRVKKKQNLVSAQHEGLLSHAMGSVTVCECHWLFIISLLSSLCFTSDFSVASFLFSFQFCTRIKSKFHILAIL